MGATGVLQIIQAFMNSSDRYTTEQIAEELQRSGVLIALMDELDDPERYEQVVPVVRRMISIGKIGMVLAYLLSPVPSRRKLLLLEELSVCYLPDCTEALRTCVQKDSDEQVREAAALVLEAQAQAQAQALALAESAAAELSTGGN